MKTKLFTYLHMYEVWEADAEGKSEVRASLDYVTRPCLTNTMKIAWDNPQTVRFLSNEYKYEDVDSSFPN